MVHSLSSRHFFSFLGGKVAWELVTPPPAPDERVFVSVPVSSTSFYSFYNLFPCFKTLPLQCQRFEYFPPGLYQIKICRIFWLIHKFPAMMMEHKKQEIIA